MSPFRAENPYPPGRAPPSKNEALTNYDQILMKFLEFVLQASEENILSNYINFSQSGVPRLKILGVLDPPLFYMKYCSSRPPGVFIYLIYMTLKTKPPNYISEHWVKAPQ